jgi:hypothetical protein
MVIMLARDEKKHRLCHEKDASSVFDYQQAGKSSGNIFCMCMAAVQFLRQR